MSALSTPFKAVCACCNRLRMVRMFVLQDGQTACVCLECRGGREK